MELPDPLKLEQVKRKIEATTANLAGSFFEDVNLTSARFHNVNLSASRIEDVDLSGLEVRDANLSGASIADSVLDRMTINGIPVEALLAAYRKVNAGGREE